MSEPSINDGTVITLLRDIDAFLIPSGTPVALTKGEEVTITQSLGSSFTVLLQGNLLRISGNDADALGLENQVAETVLAKVIPGHVVTQDEVWEALQTCYDPEIPVNIADLGLIYECRITELEDDRYQIDIEMTLTAPGCGMGPTIVQDVYDAVMVINNVVKANVEMVFDPPWDQTMMTEAAKLQLGLL